MNPMNLRRREALLSLAALAAWPGLSIAANEAPGDSIYRVNATLSDQEGRAFELASLQGSPVLASMFYTSCDMVCPMIFETIHATLRALPAKDRAAAKVLLVTFDPARDTTEVLKKMAQQRSCDAQWALARGDEATVRKVAAVLGIQYRKLSNGEYNHSSTIDLLDRNGRIVAKTGKLGGADAAFVAAIRKVTV